MGEIANGHLLLIGGAEDKVHKKLILKHFAELAQKQKSYLTILTSATSEPKKAGRKYKKVFEDLNLCEIKILHISSRDAAEKKENVELILNSGSIFFTGGDQLKITSIIGGTPVNRAIHQAYENGALIAGTSAGCSAASDVMIIGGESDDSPNFKSVNLAPGLGLIEEVVIDQHFAQRGRIGRLLTAVSYNPHILGIGIDEDTAIEVNKQAEFKVLGSNAVTIIDGKGIKTSNISEINQEKALAVTDVKLHILPDGYKYDLQKRQVIKED
ncbi:MAG: cyanophycinase [Halothermotrichaceae bacterium]